MSFDAKSAFAVFYAIFWGALLSPMGKFGPFGIAGFTKGGSAALKNAFRFLLGLAILNLLPAAWFFVLIRSDSVVPDATTAPAFLAAVLAALSVFSFVNFGYACFGARPWAECIYTEDELKELETNKVLEGVPSMHFFWLGLFYIVVFPMLAEFVGRFA
ncbi:MAG: hypothetical protein SWE60_15820 [Thermodesulfobacteriota bacterium]|nr:hypothetical protein [Thermodesulfobacteriota bacterium]